MAVVKNEESKGGNRPKHMYCTIQEREERERVCVCERGRERDGGGKGIGC